MKYLKLKYTMSLCLLGFLNANATKVVIGVEDMVFNPITVNVIVGDTIVWNWVSSGYGDHTTTSVTIPNTASSWDAKIDGISNKSFEYKITVAGTYNYQCTPHVQIGVNMRGTIIAKSSNTTRISEMNSSNKTSVYPNPFTTSTIIKLFSLASSTNLSFVMYDILGNEVRKIVSISNEQLIINREELLCGIYFYRLSDAEKVVASGKLLVE